LLCFIVGGFLAPKKSRTPISRKIIIRKSCKNIFAIYSIAYCYISLRYELYNRRIGTEAAGELFASIPLVELVLFRVYEVLFPFALAVGLITSLTAVQQMGVGLRSLRNLISGILIFFVLLLSGAMNSRSQLFFLIFSVFVIAQNVIPEKALRRYLLIGATAALVFLIGVTLSRLASMEQGFSTDFFLEEFATRLDGLDFVSRVISDLGVSWTGVNFSILAVPLLSVIPFLPEAIDLKASALTTVKASILLIEYESAQKDINSFLVLDIYYAFGIIGMAIVAVGIGYLAKWVDRKILMSGGRLSFALASAIACNLIFMEREFIGIAIGTIRDFFILCSLCVIAIKRFEINGDAGLVNSNLGKQRAIL
jgi:hypothetical protein